MFERFTDRARRVVVLAQEEARLMNHNYIGTEHLLLGLTHEGEGVAAQALARSGVTMAGLRAKTEEIIGQGGSSPSGHIPFTPRAKKVLELSLREALQLGHNYIGTEHILLGLVREGEGVAAQVLAQLGIEMSEIRRAIILLLGGVVAQGGKEGMTISGARAAISNELRAETGRLDKEQRTERDQLRAVEIISDIAVSRAAQGDYGIAAVLCRVAAAGWSTMGDANEGVRRVLTDLAAQYEDNGNIQAAGDPEFPTGQRTYGVLDVENDPDPKYADPAEGDDGESDAQ